MLKLGELRMTNYNDILHHSDHSTADTCRAFGTLPTCSRARSHLASSVSPTPPAATPAPTLASVISVMIFEIRRGDLPAHHRILEQRAAFLRPSWGIPDAGGAILV